MSAAGTPRGPGDLGGHRRAGRRRQARSLESAGSRRTIHGGGAGPVLVPLTPAALLEAQFEPADRRQSSGLLVHHLRQLSGAEARLDLSIGQGLELLSRRFDLRSQGFSHFASFAEGPCGFSAAHGRELRRPARELPALPALCDAFLAGLIPRTRLREVLSVATPETDAGWAQLARSMGTRPLARMVAAVKAGKCAAPVAAEAGSRRFERVGWLGSAADRSTWRFGLALVRQVAGVPGPEHVLVEALAAETLASVGPDDGDGPDGPLPLLRVRSRARGEHRQRAPSAGRLAQLARRLRRALAKEREVALVETPDWGACATGEQVVDALCVLVRRRRSLDWERSRLLSWMQGRRLHHELGFPRFTDAAERVLGLAPREALRLVGLARELALLPVLDSAWSQGRVGTDALERLQRVVTPEADAAWAEFASVVSPRLVDAAVETVLAMGVPRPLPPWECRGRCRRGASRCGACCSTGRRTSASRADEPRGVRAQPPRTRQRRVSAPRWERRDSRSGRWPAIGSAAWASMRLPMSLSCGGTRWRPCVAAPGRRYRTPTSCAA